MTDTPAQDNDPKKTARKVKPPSPAAVAYTPDQVAMVSPFSRSVVFAMLKSGRLKSYKGYGHRVIMRADLEALIESLKEDAA